MEFKDYYAVLGVPKTASDADIKKAYRKLARKFHPDLNPGDKTAEAKFKDINEANEVLGDPDKRRKYDELGANWRQYEQAARAGGGAAPEGWGGGFYQGPGGGATYRTMTPEEMEELFGTDDPFSDFFHTFFGGAGRGATGQARGRGTPRPRRGQDFESPLDLTLEEIFSGATRRLSFNRGGQERTVDVRIPAGVKDGARVRVSGEGGPASEGAPPGDLYLVVRQLPHARFERRGQDLHTKVAVPIPTAVLGGEVSVPTLAGTSLRLRIPELTPSGRTFRLRGHGMPTAGRADERGDLYATAEIEVPAQISPEERRHYEALRQSTVKP